MILANHKFLVERYRMFLCLCSFPSSRDNMCGHLYAPMAKLTERPTRARDMLNAPLHQLCISLKQRMNHVTCHMTWTDN